MSEFDILSASAAGMDAQRSALDLAARNVAAAEATSDGSSFARLVPQYAFGTPPGDAGGPGGFEPPEPGGAEDGLDANAETAAVRYVGARSERGVDVDAVTEMVAVLDAQRAFEANASVFDIGKRLAERTIDMGRLQ